MSNEPLAKDFATPDQYNVAHAEWQNEQPNRPYDYEKNWNRPGRDDRKFSDLNFERIGLLMKVIEMAIEHGPAFTNITAEAQFELAAYNTDALNFANDRQKAKVAADAKVKADEQTRTDELAKEQEAKLKADADAKADAIIKTQAQINAAAQAKAETSAKEQADAKAKADALLVSPVVTPVVEPPPSPFVSPEPESTMTTAPDRRL